MKTGFVYFIIRILEQHHWKHGEIFNHITLQIIMDISNTDKSYKSEANHDRYDPICKPL